MNIEDDFRLYSLRDQSYWGPYHWNFLYLSAYGLPITLTKSQASHFEYLLKHFHTFIPCIECRFHYFNLVRNMSFRLETRKDVLDSIYFIHNSIRVRLRQDQIHPPDTVPYFYKDYYLKKLKSHKVIEILLVLCIVAFLYNRRT